VNPFIPQDIAPLNHWKAVLQACGITVEELTAAGANGRLTPAELDTFFVDEPRIEHITLLLSLRPDATAIARSIDLLARRPASSFSPE
jgi:hypothetical protein